MDSGASLGSACLFPNFSQLLSTLAKKMTRYDDRDNISPRQDKEKMGKMLGGDA
jgi:hypothetical protein